ncbi:MAG: hypothetical protein WCR68_03255, partial [Candidatus Dojkabacteria bacterium]
MDDTALINNRNSAQNDFQEDINLLHQKLSNSNVPPDLKEETLRAISRLSRIARYGNYSTEFETIDKYVDWISRIPWGVVTQDSYNIDNAKQIMDSTHYGMDTIK